RTPTVARTRTAACSPTVARRLLGIVSGNRLGRVAAGRSATNRRRGGACAVGLGDGDDDRREVGAAADAARVCDGWRRVWNVVRTGDLGRGLGRARSGVARLATTAVARMSGS